MFGSFLSYDYERATKKLDPSRIQLEATWKVNYEKVGISVIGFTLGNMCIVCVCFSHHKWVEKSAKELKEEQTWKHIHENEIHWNSTLTDHLTTGALQALIIKTVAEMLLKMTTAHEKVSICIAESPSEKRKPTTISRKFTSCHAVLRPLIPVLVFVMFYFVLSFCTKAYVLVSKLRCVRDKSIATIYFIHI